MKQCKRCDSTSLTYVTEYEHLDFEGEDYIKDNGWLCDACECFHAEDESYWGYDIVEKIYTTNYKQLWGA